MRLIKLIFISIIQLFALHIEIEFVYSCCTLLANYYVLFDYHFIYFIIFVAWRYIKIVYDILFCSLYTVLFLILCLVLKKLCFG